MWRYSQYYILKGVVIYIWDKTREGYVEDTTFWEKTGKSIANRNLRFIETMPMGHTGRKTLTGLKIGFYMDRLAGRHRD